MIAETFERRSGGDIEMTGRSNKTWLRLCGAIVASIATCFAIAAPAQAVNPGWGYEQVTPIAKGPGTVSNSDTFTAAEYGTSLLYSTRGSFSSLPAESVPLYTRYGAHRTETGWQNRGIDPRFLLPPDGVGKTILTIQLTLGLSRNAKYALVTSQDALTPGAAAGGSNIYIVNTLTGEAKLVAADPDPAMTMQLTTLGGMGNAHFVANDGSAALFSATRAELLPGAGTTNLYLWRESTGLELPGRLPESEGGGVVRAFPFLQSEVGTRDPMLYDDSLNRIYWNDEDTKIAYVREAGESKPISVSQIDGAPTTPVAGYIRAVSGDGRYVFFNTINNARLTDSTPDSGYPGNSHHLYRYDADAESDPLTYIGTVAAGGAVSTDLIQVSATGDTAVFRSNLSQTPPASAGAIRAFIWRRGEVSQIVQYDPGSTGESNVRSLVYLSANGRYFAFTDTSATLAQSFGIDNLSANCTEFGMPSRCLVVYAYDAEQDQLSCVSCNPDGSPPVFDSGDPDVVSTVRGTPTPGYVRFMQHQARTVANDGTVFFTTVDGLVPEDNNGRKDAYAWKEGDLTLISRARTGHDSRFLDASVDGKIVYFSTTDPIAPVDRDSARDIYATYAGAGIEYEDDAFEAPVCNGPGCRVSEDLGPAGPTVGSVDYLGAGNVSSGSGSSHGRRAHVSRVRYLKGRAVVRVRVPGAGRILARAPGFLPVTKRVDRAGVYRVTLGAKRTVLMGKRTRSRVRVLFIDSQGRRSSGNMVVRVKQAARSAKSSRGAK